MPGVEGSQAGALELLWALLDFLLACRWKALLGRISGGMTLSLGWDHLLGCVSWILGPQVQPQGPSQGMGTAGAGPGGH